MKARFQHSFTHTRPHTQAHKHNDTTKGHTHTSLCGATGLTPSLCGATGLTPSRVGHWGSRRPVWWGCGRGSWPLSVASLPRGPSPRPGGSPRAVRPGPPPPGRLPPALRAFVFLAPAPSWAPLPAPALGGSFLRRRRFASVVLGAGACRPFSPAPRLPPFPLLFFVGLLCFVWSPSRPRGRVRAPPPRFEVKWRQPTSPTESICGVNQTRYAQTSIAYGVPLRCESNSLRSNKYRLRSPFAV